MNHTAAIGDDARREEAATWVVRLQSPLIDSADAAAFGAWLHADAANGYAYDEALAVWREYGASALAVARGLSDRRALPARRAWVMGFGAAAAAAAVAVAVLPRLADTPHAQVYATGRGEHRTVTLGDGSRLDLNAGTRLTVTLDRRARSVVLSEGEAVFDVAHDARRPFEIAAGDRTVRVIGTQFDVRRREGRLSVTVARGAVEVRPATGAEGMAYRLHPGQRLDHQEGAAAVRVSAIEAADVLGWRSGRLVYRGEPLAQVVADLNQQFATPIRIEDPELAAVPVSGVLVLDDQAAVIRRLALLAPLKAVPSKAGLVLRREGAPKP
jgi:transmembrane sensor